jgi:hypothetical protein
VDSRGSEFCERGSGDMEGSIIVDALKYFLHDRQAGNDFFARDCRRIPVTRSPAQHLDPGARIDENHR